MHCPGCGQQQVNDDIRFCSRCGLPLSLISEVVANCGVLPELEKLKNKKTFISRKAGIFFGISWILFFVLVVSLFLEVTKAPGEVTSFAVFLGILTGVMIILASVFFLDNHTGRDRKDFGGGEIYPERNRRDLNYSSPNGPNALPPQQSVPAQNYAAPAQPGGWKTNDLAPPGVTDNTTKLLDDE